MHLTIHTIHGKPGEPETELHVSGDVLTFDGKPWDFSDIPEGGEGTLDDEDSPFIGPIQRIDGLIHATVLVRVNSTAELCDVSFWVIPDADGEVYIPVARRHPDDEECEMIGYVTPPLPDLAEPAAEHEPESE